MIFDVGQLEYEGGSKPYLVMPRLPAIVELGLTRHRRNNRDNRANSDPDVYLRQTGQDSPLPRARSLPLLHIFNSGHQFTWVEIFRGAERRR